MTVYAGNIIESSDFNGLEKQATVTSFGTVAAGFTATASYARVALGGKLIYFRLELTNTSGITSTSNNITDTLVFTLDADYRPSENAGGVWSANPGTGEFQVFANGNVTLRTGDATVAASSSVRLSCTYMKD